MRTFFFILFFPFVLAAQDRQSTDTALAKALLWKISGNGTTKESYLYGTIHIIPTTDIDTPAVLRNALYHTDALYLEIVDTNNFLPDNRSISELVRKKYLRKINDAVEKMHAAGGDTSRIYNYMPWLYPYVIMGASLNCTMTAYEIVLTGMATNNKMPVFALETYDDRDSIMRKHKSPSLREQAKSLENFIDELDQSLKMFKENLADYKAHDIASIYARTTYVPIRLFNQRTALSKVVLDKRNALWLPRMELAMKKQSCFFAVGTAHLAGKEGLISILRKEGYTVTPVF